jgi:predicted ATP-dependent protease
MWMKSSEDISNQINFIFVEHLDEVLQIALKSKVKGKKGRRSLKNKTTLPAA